MGFSCLFYSERGMFSYSDGGESGGRLVGDGGWRGLDIFVVLTALFL